MTQSVCRSAAERWLRRQASTVAPIACAITAFTAWSACQSTPPVEPANPSPAPSTNVNTNTSPIATAGTSAPVSTGAAGLQATGVPRTAAGSGATAGSTPSAAAGSSGSSAAGAATAGTSGSDAAASGSSGSAVTDAGAGAVAGTGGTAAPGIPLKECPTGSLEACGTILTADGMKIPLGPYGSIMEPNMGAGFETTIASGDSDGGATCRLFASSFGEDAESTDRLLDTGDLKFDLYTVYRPANMKEGETYPILTWGNGTCAQPEGYGPLLRYVASHGFFVFAANSRWVGGNSAMTKALDFAFAANADEKSPYYKRLDTTRVGAMGHSQGSAATASAARDARVKTVILFNGGTSATKRFLAISSDRDIGNPTAATYRSGVESSNLGAAFIFYHKIPGTGTASGHLTLMTQPTRVIEPTVAWFKFTLSDDADAKTFFIGDACKLCNMTDEFDYGQKGLE